MEPKKTGKRIVSKGEYVNMQADRVLGGFFGGLAACIAVICALFSFCGCLGVIANLWFFHSKGVEGACVCLFATVLTGYGAHALYANGMFLMKEAAKTDPGIPLTRANTADLPAPDSLVRASSEPMQEQEAVLLRAATKGQETPPEQLVRAVNGPHSDAL